MKTADIKINMSISSHILFAIAISITIFTIFWFSGTAYRIDEPNYLWPAKRILDHPLDPYGFKINWYHKSQDAFYVNLNPPFNSYYIALSSLIGGWGERWIHLAFLPPALLALWATYRLGRILGCSGGAAALFLSISPCFLVGATTVMVEVWLTALWTTACFYWIRGFSNKQMFSFLIAMACASVVTMTKYFGIFIIPLLAVYAILKDGVFSRKLLWLLLPLSIFAAWLLASRGLYGATQLSLGTATSSAYNEITAARRIWKILIALTFLGGTSLFPVLIFYWNRSRWIIFSGLAIFAGLGLAGILAPKIGMLQYPLTYGATLMFAVFGTIGYVEILFLIKSIQTDLNHEIAMMLLWICITVIFVIFFNWTISARHLLPIMPALAILTERELTRHIKAGQPLFLIFSSMALLLAILSISFMVAGSDALAANNQRKAAQEIMRGLDSAVQKVYFQGHWGFQYYMQELGGKPVEYGTSQVEPKDILINPTGNYDVMEINKNAATLLGSYKENEIKPFSTMDRRTGAGFYTSEFGPLPYSVPNPNPNFYLIYKAN